jgi:hypothetical protein
MAKYKCTDKVVLNKKIVEIVKSIENFSTKKTTYLLKDGRVVNESDLNFFVENAKVITKRKNPTKKSRNESK